MLEDNKALVRRYVEDFQSAGKVETANELVDTDIIHHFGPAWMRADTIGREGAKQFITMLRAAFPDLHAVIHDQIGEGDKVMTRKTFYGTYRGEFWGVHPTGKQVTIDVIDIVRIANDQMVEHWNVVPPSAGRRGASLAANPAGTRGTRTGPRLRQVNASGRPLRCLQRPKGGGRRLLAATGRPPPRQFPTHPKQQAVSGGKPLNRRPICDDWR